MDESVQKHLKPRLDETSALLLRAAAYIEQHGWCQGQAFIGERACIMGALHVVHSGEKRDGSLAGPVEHCFTRLNATLGMGPRRWNDADGRTQEEVVAKLRAVALSPR